MISNSAMNLVRNDLVFGSDYESRGNDCLPSRFFLVCLGETSDYVNRQYYYASSMSKPFGHVTSPPSSTMSNTFRPLREC